MEMYIERAGGPLAALRRIVETDVADLLRRSLPPLAAASASEQDAALQAVTVTLEDFFHCVEYTLLQAYYALPDERAERRYLTECQHTVLQLLGHLQRYTDSRQLYSEQPPGSLSAACCRHLYRELRSLLDYTVELADGQVDVNLTLPPAARSLFQETVAGDIGVLREYLEATHVSPALMDITLAPFQALADARSVKLYQVYYLHALKEALLLPAPAGYDADGDGPVLWTLLAQNYNAPAFMRWLQPVSETQRVELNGYKRRLMNHCSKPSPAWMPQHPSVSEQLGSWLEMGVMRPEAIPVKEGVDEAKIEAEPLADDLFSLDDFTLRISPKVVAAIANAARVLHYIFWGKNISHIAEMVARIPTVHRTLNAASLRRGMGELATLRQAREILLSIIHFFDDQIKALEEKIFR